MDSSPIWFQQFVSFFLVQTLVHSQTENEVISMTKNKNEIEAVQAGSTKYLFSMAISRPRVIVLWVASKQMSSMAL
jgi:hypothetical protein